MEIKLYSFNEVLDLVKMERKRFYKMLKQDNIECIRYNFVRPTKWQFTEEQLSKLLAHYVTDGVK